MWRRLCVLTRQVLVLDSLWRDFQPSDRIVMLQLMKAFKLVRQLSGEEKFLVPAMLPRGELPAEYLSPYWWRPAKARACAWTRPGRRAEMRMMYKVRGSRLPLGFKNELQVRLATQNNLPTGSQSREVFLTCEAALVDRIAGSVLSMPYKCGGGKIGEWVILSLGPAQGGGPPTTDCIRVMAWVELTSSSPEGAVDWRLFRHVMKEIDRM
jgi:hypothetical protein